MNEAIRKPNESRRKYFLSGLDENGNLLIPPYYWSKLGENGELLVPSQIEVVSVYSTEISAACVIKEILHRPAIKLVHDMQKIFERLELNIKKNADGGIAITGNDKVKFVEWEPNLWLVMSNAKTVAQIALGVNCGMCAMELNVIE